MSKIQIVTDDVQLNRVMRFACVCIWGSDSQSWCSWRPSPTWFSKGLELCSARGPLQSCCGSGTQRSRWSWSQTLGRPETKTSEGEADGERIRIDTIKNPPQLITGTSWACTWNLCLSSRSSRLTTSLLTWNRCLLKWTPADYWVKELNLKDHISQSSWTIEQVVPAIPQWCVFRGLSMSLEAVRTLIH